MSAWPGSSNGHAPTSLRSLEASWRGSRHVPNAAAGARLADAADQHLAVLRALPSAPLPEWLEALRGALAAGGEMAAMRADAAGRQVIDALWLGGEGPPAAAIDAARRWRPTLSGFTAWVEAALDAASFLPPLPETVSGTRIVITPLARTVGRPFVHIALAGADERNLGATPLPPGLIGPARAEAWGLATPQTLRQRQRQAIAQLLRAGGLSVLRRRADGDAAIAASTDLEWLWLRLAAAAQPVPAELPWSPAQRWRATTPVPRPLPRAAHAMPQTLSATHLDALRGCPYRFFARAVLRLAENEELDEPLDKREYGIWLHELLHAFHRERARAAIEPARDPARLQAAADAAADKLGLDAADLLPFRASFDAFAPVYLRWQHAREAAGWTWIGLTSP